jgi:hypothetical protein
MSTIFDTLKFVEKLEEGGFTHGQARAAATAFADAVSDRLVTKSDLREEVAPLKTDIAILKWMAGFTLAAVVAILFMLVRH